MSNNEYQDYLEETKKSDNVALAAALSKTALNSAYGASMDAALSKAALNSAYGAAIKVESMGNDHPLKNVGKEVETYVTRRDKRGE